MSSASIFHPVLSYNKESMLKMCQSSTSRLHSALDADQLHTPALRKWIQAPAEEGWVALRALLDVVEKTPVPTRTQTVLIQPTANHLTALQRFIQYETEN
jgi:hypothetical protein